MERRWRAATIVLSVLLLASLLWGALQWSERARAESLQAAQFQRAFFELVAQVEQTQVLMAKSLVAGSDGQRVIHLTDVWRQAFGAQANLNQLPLGTISLMRTSQLLTQAGDYAYLLARRAAKGESISDEQWETLSQLQRQVGLIAEHLHDVVDTAARGGMSWREMQRLTRRRLEEGPNEFRDGFERLELQLVEFPTLIYDGPFSDHIIQREPRGLTGADIDAAQARRIAAEFLPYEVAVDDVHDRGEVEGPVDAFKVRVVRREGLIDLDISRRGGHVVWMLDSRAVSESNISVDHAIARAAEFLADRGMSDMVATWATEVQNRVVIPFALVQDDVVVYPDLVKVTVALDNGEIIGYEALGYLMAHHERDLPSPAFTEAEARERVHPALSVGEGRLALIPLETLAEVLTWEFPADLNGDPYLVYINAVTGDEEQILKLLTTNEGTLVL